MNPTPTPYPEHNRALRELVERVQANLGEQCVGAYLQGSFAIGDFDQHSDVDFIIVTRDHLSASEVQSLQLMHKRIFHLDTAWAQHLEGSYFSQSLLRDLPIGERGRWQPKPPGYISPVWYLDNGSSTLIQSDHCNTLVVRWALREHGVTLVGPAPTTLVDPIPAAALRAEILATMRIWGADILAHPDEYDNRFYQTYIVLSYCRMLHDLRNGFPGSKPAGAAWAKANLNPSWGALIDRTWAGRPVPEVSVRQPADPADFRATLEFVRYALGEADAYAEANHIE